MSYTPNGFVSGLEEEEEVLRVRLMGSTSDISVHRFVASQQVNAEGFSVSSCDSTTILSNRRGSASPSGSFRRPRPLPPLNPLTLLNSSKSTSSMIPPAEAEETLQPPQPVPSSVSSSESPFLRRLDSFRRSSTEFSMSSFRQTYSNSTNGGNSGASTNNPDFDNDLGSDPSMDPLAVKQSSSSESQAFYGNEDVVKDLKPEYARWFYKYEPDRAWTPFTGYDSIRMEQRYRNLMLEREALYGNMSRGHLNEDGYDYSGDSNGFDNCTAKNAQPEGIGASADEESKEEKRKNGEETFGENVIIVRGGLYEADLENWTCVATYWPGDKCQLQRGTWFYDGTWQPLNTEHAEKLEEEHLGQFSGVSLSVFDKADITSQPDSPTKKNRPVIHRVSFCEFHVDWTSPTEIHLFSKAASYKFMRSVGQRLGFQTWGHRVCRGYFKQASLEDRPSEISHLVFVVHGIGQKMDTGRIVRNCSSFRDTVSSLKEKFYPHLNETKQRAEFFPVEWRSAAKLDGDVVDAITPHKLLSLRQILNSTAMDIMYYTSPLYRTEIQNALRNELNRIYSNFMKRNPEFRSRGGKCSIIAHSLGAVIAYDIITGYMPQSMPEIPTGVPLQVNGHAKEPLPGLLFQLEHFFCLGSPLSVFLALRWREPHNPLYRSYILPNLLCKRIYNVFYSTDPVAYRLEPLFNKHYVQISPLPVHTYGYPGRPRYDEMPRERISKEINFVRQPEPTGSNPNPNNGIPSNSQQESIKSTPQRTLNLKSPPTPTRESNWGWASLMKYLKSADPGIVSGGLSDGDMGAFMSPEGNNTPEEGNTTPEDIASDIPNDLDYRMDYVLKESNFSSTYLAALTSHTSYWSSPDTAYFVLTHLYGDLLDLAPAQ